MGFPGRVSESMAGQAPAQLLVTRLVPEQWAIYRQVRLAALTDAPYAFGSTLERELTFGDDLWQQRISRAATFLALLDGHPVGTATAIADDPDDEFAVPGAWQLVGMWVAAGARGRGVADRLVEAVADHVRGAGSPTLVR